LHYGLGSGRPSQLLNHFCFWPYTPIYLVLVARVLRITFIDEFLVVMASVIAGKEVLKNFALV